MRYGVFDVMALFDNATMFPPEAAEKLKAIFRPVDYRKHDYFIRCGDQPHSVALILNGYFRSFVLDENGNEITQYFYFDGSVLYPYEAAHRKAPNAYDLMAEEDSRLLVAEIDAFEATMNDSEALRQLYRRIMSDVMAVKNAHALSFKTSTNEERYRNLLARHPDIEQRVRQYHLASFLGMTPVTLSRLRARLINR